MQLDGQFSVAFRPIILHKIDMSRKFGINMNQIHEEGIRQIEERGLADKTFYQKKHGDNETEEYIFLLLLLNV